MQSLHSSLSFGRLTHIPSNVARNFSKGYRSRPWFHCTSSTTNLSDSIHTCHEQPQPQASITLLQIVHTFLPRRTIRIGGASALRLAERDHVSCSAIMQIVSLFVSDGHGLAFQSAQNLEQVAVPHPS